MELPKPTELEILAKMQRDPLHFVLIMFGLTHQPLRPEYIPVMRAGLKLDWEEWEEFRKTISADWFEPFVRGKHITWQQYVILLALGHAVAGKASKKISIVSGRGIGKSSILALIVLWFLFCFPKSKIPCTAVTSDQLSEALWSEISVWLEKMPETFRKKFVYSSDHVRRAEAPDSWFARARTASKDRPEALSGIHAPWILGIVDEASAVHERVFEMGQGILTSDQAFLIMISNGTVRTGYFYRSHHENKSAYQSMSLSSAQSPIVDRKYIQSVIDEYCRGVEPKDFRNITEYRVNVSGLFPLEGIMDDSGYVQLIDRDKIEVRVKSELDVPFVGRKILGVDPSGEGKDECVYAIRDRFKAEVVHKERTTNPRKIAEKIITLIQEYKLDPKDVVVGSFGVGTDVAKEVAISSKGKYDIYSVLEGNSPLKEEAYNSHFFTVRADEVQNDEDGTDKWIDLYANIRALMAFRLRKWIIAGGQIVDSSVVSSIAKEISDNRYKRIGNKIQMMPKKDMLKLGIRSTNQHDAIGLTMLRDIDEQNWRTDVDNRDIDEDEVISDNAYYDRFSSV